MTNKIQARLLSAAYACLRPLSRLLLRSGITYRQFELVAKRAFVQEAMEDSKHRSRTANTSRIAVKTGLSRKEVKRIRECLGGGLTSEQQIPFDSSGPLARVLHAWHVDRRFVCDDGAPRDLEFQDVEHGFDALVRSVAGDVPPGAVRAELKLAGAVADLEDGRLRVIKRHYVPGNVDDKAITVMSKLVFPLVAGIVHNSDPARTSDGFIQRFAFSDSLDPSVIPQFRKWSRSEATKFLETTDDWLAAHETAPADNPKPRPVTAGIGVFYYEGVPSEEIVRDIEP